MSRRVTLWICGAILAIPLAGFAAWLLGLPSVQSYAPPAIDRAENDVMLASLKPSRRARPRVAIVGINDATENTDYLTPYGILRRAKVVAAANGGVIVTTHRIDGSWWTARSRPPRASALRCP